MHLYRRMPWHTRSQFGAQNVMSELEGQGRSARAGYRLLGEQK